jgi:hypothetical protein
MSAHFRPGTAVRLQLSLLEMNDEDTRFSLISGRELLLDVPPSWDTEMLIAHLRNHISSIINDCHKEAFPNGTP